ncbi:MAG: hypothetical protein R3321_13935, partial [Nitrososphaeraceae archaeon]|nr:hypothetical protein [Nitrososphaeraceae archaeon]
MQDNKQIKPSHFKIHEFNRTYKSLYNEDQIWNWLNDPKTFTDNQVWPYRVEFLPGDQHKQTFETGVLNNHHGPFLSLAGRIGEIAPNYRDLQYFYGSYAISFRYIRPYRLQFWTEDLGDHRIVRVQLSSYVHPTFYKMWNFSQKIFWSHFGSWMNKSIKKITKST